MGSRNSLAGPVGLAGRAKWGRWAGETARAARGSSCADRPSSWRPAGQRQARGLPRLQTPRDALWSRKRECGIEAGWRVGSRRETRAEVEGGGGVGGRGCRAGASFRCRS